MQYMTFMYSKDNVPYFITNAIDPNTVPLAPSAFDEMFPCELTPTMEVDPLTPQYQNNMPDHPVGCRCVDCYRQYHLNDVRCHNMYKDNQNLIDLRYLAFPYVSNMNQAYTRFVASVAKRKRPIEVLSPHVLVEYQYNIIMVKDNGEKVSVPYVARSKGRYDFFMTNERHRNTNEMSLFNYIDTSDVIEIRPEWNYCRYYLQIKSVSVWGSTAGQGVDIQNGAPSFVGVPIDTQILLYRTILGDEGCPLIYDVRPHDRVRVRFYTIFNDCVILDDLHDVERSLNCGIPYKFIDPVTVPRLCGIPMYGMRNISLHDIFDFD